MIASTESSSFNYKRQVTFADTDAAGVAHFTKIAAYIEEALHAFLINYQITIDANQHGWPIVKLDIDYRDSIQFGDEVTVLLEPFSAGKSAFTFSFSIQKETLIVAEGVITIVAVDQHKKPRQLPIICHQLVSSNQ